MTLAAAPVELTLSVEREGFRLHLREKLPAEGLTVLFGPSGSGKTTVLRCVAGLEPSATGRIAIGEEVWLDQDAGIEVPTHTRGVGYVFQDAALFPHLTVRGNLEFGWTRTPAEERGVDFDEVVRWMGLEGMLDRAVPGLSGGERQRVAMARAVLAGPRMLLMDEPFASLDRASRRALLPYLEELRHRLEVPVLHVTHDPREAAHLADHVLLLDKGEVVARGGPEVLPEEEADAFAP